MGPCPRGMVVQSPYELTAPAPIWGSGPPRHARTERALPSGMRPQKQRGVRPSTGLVRDGPQTARAAPNIKNTPASYRLLGLAGGCQWLKSSLEVV